MKITTLLLTIGLFQVSASVKSQGNAVSISEKGISLEELFWKIQEESNFVFVFNEEHVNEYTNLDINLNGDLDKVLTQILSDKNLTYEKKHEVYVIKKAPIRVAEQQDGKRINVQGVVTDSEGVTLPMATVLVKGTTKGISTDAEGRYYLHSVPSNAVLVCSFVGYEIQEIPINGKTTINWKLKFQSNSLDDVTVVAFGTQKRESVVSSITTVSPMELKIPESDLTNALAGRVAGLIAYQRSGEPGEDNTEFFIRGVTTFGTGKADPLILIDGVEVTRYDLSRISADDIQSFSILKDASATSLYGARGANGVIYVKSKVGTEGKTRFSARFENSFSMSTKDVELADPITYMRLYNEAITTRNPLDEPKFSSEKISKTEKGLDPRQYPNVDWQDMLFKKFTQNQRYNLSASGGGKRAKFYVSGAYSKDNGILNVAKENNFNSNIEINRYLLRSNVNINVTKTTELVVRLNGTFEDYSGPLEGGSDTYKKVMRTSATLFHPFYQADKDNEFTDHILFGNHEAGAGYLNPYADMVKGYKEKDKSVLLAQVEINQDLSAITPGLRLHGKVQTSRTSDFGTTRQYNPFFYQYKPIETMDGPSFYLDELNEESGTDYLSYTELGKSVSSVNYQELVLRYNRTFNEKHDISSRFVGTRRETKTGNAGSLQLSLPGRNMGLAGSLAYGYDSKYFIEANFGYNGSERFHKSERFGFFPSIALGWVISNEEFMQPISHIISKMKFFGSYGLVGNDQIGRTQDRFFYLSEVNMNNGGQGYAFGTDLQYRKSGVSQSRYANKNITWEIGKKLNVGVDMKLIKDVHIVAEYFLNKRTNILQTRAYIPRTMGLQSTPQANVGSARSEGVDIGIDYNKSWNKDVWTTVRGNFTYSTSEFTTFEEPSYEDSPWRLHEGQKINQEWGLVAERLFIDDNEVQSSPRQDFGTYSGGDIKYKDINKDGVINNYDKVPIGLPKTPEIIYGFGVSQGYKSIDLSFFFQGSARSSFWIDANATAPFIGGAAPNQLLKAYADNHWSEDNRNLHALWPRLSAGNVGNNSQQSTYFMRSGAFLRLKSLQIGYTLPKNISNKLKLGKARFYLSGANLLTISSFKLWDPEMAGNGLAYPVQKVYNIGVNINF